MFRKMLEEDRRRAGWSVGQAAWHLGITLREYRELEAGERWPNGEMFNRVRELFRLAADVRGPRVGGYWSGLSGGAPLGRPNR